MQETHFRGPRARHYLAWIKQQIDQGTFDLTKEFPEYAARHGTRVPVSVQSCAQVFDAFLRHEEAQVRRGELTQATVDAHRQILNRSWRLHIGHELFKQVTATRLDEVADAQGWSKNAYKNSIGAIKSAFAFGSRDFPERQNPAAALRYPRIDKPEFDPFSIHEAERFIAALHADWGEAEGNFHELRFFTGPRPCETIPLLVSDYDRVNGTLNISKTRVRGRDRYSTKRGKDRSVRLCPRAIAILERHLRLRAQMVARGLIEHEAIFFTDTGAPIRSLAVTGRRWSRTLHRLPMRYRRPYVAHHTSVSWNLMLDNNRDEVANQHGHNPVTMYMFYAAWVNGAKADDIDAIRRAKDSTMPWALRLSRTGAAHAVVPANAGSPSGEAPS